MKHRIILILITLVIIKFVSADTHIPEGEISGVWNQDGSPYILEGTTTVPIDSILIINPGVEVIFSTNNLFNIHGTLRAEGSSIDSIYFSAQNTAMPYLTFIDLNETSQDSSFACFTTFNGVSIYCENSDYLSIKNSTIKNSKGLLLTSSSPIMDSLMINNNYKENKGGGIYCRDGSSPLISNSYILNNDRGGIACEEYSNPILTNVIIAGSNALCGVLSKNSSPTINYSTICNNTAGVGVGGDSIINYNDYPTVIINYSDISNNNEAGVSIGNGNLVINHTTIANNNSGGISFYGSGILEINYSKIINNSAYIASGIDIEGINNSYTNFVNITRTLISGNTAEEIAGISARSSILNLTNVTITDNNTFNGMVGGLSIELGGELYINNSIIHSNSGLDFFTYFNDGYSINYSNIGDNNMEHYGAGVINEDPLFIDEEFHLSENSPCIDTGTPDINFYEIEDPENPGFALYPAMGILRSDMGAYGGNGYNGYQVDSEEIEIPEINSIQLSNYPNPFNPSTTIYFTARNAEYPEIEIYNIKGQRIREFKMKNVKLNSGSDGREMNKVTWNGTDQAGNPVASGVYFYKLNVENSPIGKMVLLK